MRPTRAPRRCVAGHKYNNFGRIDDGVVTDLMTHAHGLVRLPAARITRETFNCSNPCTERGKMGAECKGDQISAYRCNVS